MTTKRTKRREHGKTSRWTATSIRALPARSSPYTDPSTPNLQLFVRARQDGSVRRSWLLHIKWRGEELRLAIGTHPETTLDAARAEVRRLRELTEKGIDPRSARPRRNARPAPVPGGAAIAPENQHSVDFLASEFVERFLRPNRKRPEWAEQIIGKHILPELRGRDARTVTPREVVELLDKVAQNGKVIANRAASLIAQMFKYGIHRAIVDATPVQLLFRPGGKERARERALTDAELKAYLADPLKCTRYPRLAHVVTILLLTAQRRGELAAAKWADVDLTARAWTIPDENSKTGRGHTVPLSDWAMEEFRALKALAKRSPWVLPDKDASQHVDPKLLTRGIAKCLKRFEDAGIAAFVLHDLRRTARTGLGKLKIAPHIAERVLNHVQPGVTDVYDRGAYLDEKREALQKWAAHLQGLTP